MKVKPDGEGTSLIKVFVITALMSGYGAKNGQTFAGHAGDPHKNLDN